MRTTVHLNDGLKREVSRQAAREGKSFTQAIEEAVAMWLTSRRSPAKPVTPLPSYRGDGLQPGVNLDDNTALLEMLEADLPPERRR